MSIGRSPRRCAITSCYRQLGCHELEREGQLKSLEKLGGPGHKRRFVKVDSQEMREHAVFRVNEAIYSFFLEVVYAADSGEHEHFVDSGCTVEASRMLVDITMSQGISISTCR